MRLGIARVELRSRVSRLVGALLRQRRCWLTVGLLRWLDGAGVGKEGSRLRLIAKQRVHIIIPF